MTDVSHIGEDRRREIAKKYWRVRKEFGEAAALQRLAVDYTLSIGEARAIAKEFPEE